MKVAVALVAASLFVATAKADDAPVSVQSMIAALSGKCLTETQSPPENAKMFDGQMKLPTTESERCFMECVYKGIGFITKDGEFSPEGAKKLADTKYKDSPEELEAANKVIVDCTKEIKKNESIKCPLAESIRQCIIKHKDQVNFFGTPTPSPKKL